MITSLKQYYTYIRPRWIEQGDCIKESNWHGIMRADLLIQAPCSIHLERILVQYCFNKVIIVFLPNLFDAKIVYQ